MKNMDINKLKRPVKYGEISLMQPNKKEDHMFTGLKYQLKITDILIDDIYVLAHLQIYCSPLIFC